MLLGQEEWQEHAHPVLAVKNSLSELQLFFRQNLGENFLL